MSYNITTRHYCSCDGCGKGLRMHDITYTDFIKKARKKYGWSIGKNIKCKTCKEGGEKSLFSWLTDLQCDENGHNGEYD